MSGSRTGADGCGSVSGGKGIGPGFGFSGSDGSCGVTGGISGLSFESATRLFVKLCNDDSPLFETLYYGRTMFMFSLTRTPENGGTPRGNFCVCSGFSSPWTIRSRAMILGSAN